MRLRKSLAIGCVAWVLALAWDLTGWDLPVMGALGTEAGFALRHNLWLEAVLHDTAHQAALGLLAAVAALSLPPLRRRWAPHLAVPWQALAGVLMCLLLAGLMKRYSTTSCPWDLQAFGGVARYVSHWNWGALDGGSGRCFPGGHASAAFAFWPVALAWSQSPVERTRRLGRWMLWAVLAAGMVFGGVQTLRGAHYPSHTLWTAVLCWTVAVVMQAMTRGQVLPLVSKQERAQRRKALPRAAREEAAQ